MYRILIADDEPDILRGLEYVVNWEEYGAEIAGQAKNGVEALGLLEATNVDLLLTDIRMPKMDGLSLIRRLKEEGSPVRCIILSGYDDFEYIKEAVKLGIENYLLKPVDPEELSSTLISTLDKIERDRLYRTHRRQEIRVFHENVLQRWATSLISGAELKERAKMAGIILEECEYTLGRIRLINPGKDMGTEARWLEAGDICVGRILRGEQAEVFSDISGDVLILLRGGGREKALALLNRCVGALNRILGFNVFGALGKTILGFESLPESYESTAALLGYSLLLPANSIADYQEIKRAAKERESKILINFENFERLLQSKQRTECRSFIEERFASLSALRGVTPLFVQNMAADLLFFTWNTVRRAMREPALSEEWPVDFSHVYRIYSIRELSAFVAGAADKALDMLERQESSCSPHMKLILDYIHANYAKELSIKSLSKQFNISPAYLGQIFKSTTGELLTDYVNRIRVERAKELLITTRLKGAEVSEKVGYTNTNYFYRIFKKTVGLSPSEYRQS